MTSRWTRFVSVGIAGVLVQLGALWLLTSWLHWAWLPSTIVSVEAAVLHNFCWHARWTWRDRAGHWPARFVRFQLINGAASLAGNACLMALFVARAGLPAVPANVLAIATMSIVNFLAADCWVFARHDPAKKAGRAVILCVACLLTAARASAQAPATIAAWERYVAETEATLERERALSRPRVLVNDVVTAGGETVRVAEGTISDWHGAVFIRGVTLDRLLYRLQHPGTPPPQDDVISAFVLGRTDDSLRLSIRLARRAIVTVTYDTEHEMRFRRWTPRLADARSVATRIEEIGGSDHGFLWRLHSYWTYEETDDGVVVNLRSLTLSRDVPSIVRPIAAPLVTRIARESVVRTLEALRRFYTG